MVTMNYKLFSLFIFYYILYCACDISRSYVNMRRYKLRHFCCKQLFLCIYSTSIDLKTIYIHSWPKKWHIIVKFFRLILRLSIIFLYSSLSLFSLLLAILFVLVNASLLCCLSSIFCCITNFKGFRPLKNMFLLLFIWNSKWHGLKYEQILCFFG